MGETAKPLKERAPARIQVQGRPPPTHSNLAHNVFVLMFQTRWQCRWRGGEQWQQARRLLPVMWRCLLLYPRYRAGARCRGKASRPQEARRGDPPTCSTGSDEATFRCIGKAISTYPTSFTPHRNLARILSTCGKTVEEGTNIDWFTAEALGFGSLTLEKIHVSGQNQQYIPLNDLGSSQVCFVICNLSLFEYGTLGFELGYSLVSPDSLTVWEAQFGDFANNAQCIVDQFIAARERKWLQRTGLAEHIALLTSALAQPRLAPRAPLPRHLHPVGGSRSTAQSRRSLVNFSPPPSTRGLVDRSQSHSGLGSQFEQGYPIYQTAPHHTEQYDNQRFPSSLQHAHTPDADGGGRAILAATVDVAQSAAGVLSGIGSKGSLGEVWDAPSPYDPEISAFSGHEKVLVW
ncbi:Transketolase, pyrimidine binding domain-containing protein [Mycena olivaceomarginata]|nr:Transketolase, pyrimidine binding domain-containing protein [Mycena olivaceomarginata]